MGYKYFMNNPVGARVGDCAVRAISKVLNLTWEEAYAKLAMGWLLDYKKRFIRSNRKVSRAKEP